MNIMKEIYMNQSQSSREVRTIIQLSNGVRFDAIIEHIGDVKPYKGGYNFGVGFRSDIDRTFFYSKLCPTQKEAEVLRKMYVDTLNSRPEVFSVQLGAEFEEQVSKHANIHKEPQAVIPIEARAEIRRAYQQGYRAGRKYGFRQIAEPIKKLLKI